MDKKTLLAIILSLGVLIGYPYLMRYINPPQPKARHAQTAANAQQAPTPGTPAAPAARQPASAAPAKAPEPTEPEDLATIETPLFRAVFTSRGGGVRQWELKEYSETLEKGSKGIDLAATVATGDSLATRLSSNGITEDLVFSLPRSATVARGETKEFVLTAKTPSGLVVVKKYTVTGGSYVVKTDLSVVNKSGKAYQGLAQTFLVSSAAGKDKTGYHEGPVIRTKKEITREWEKTPDLSGKDAMWIGVENKYFLSALIPTLKTTSEWSAYIDSKTYASATLSVPLKLPADTISEFTYNTFVGPKAYDLLVKQKLGLDESIQFGMFGFLARPMLVTLNFFERFIGNYGIAIIIITVLIKIIFYPLSNHSFKSMREMQKLQPQLAAIKEKYKDDKEKLNKELMEMYKRYKVNPLGGCLPMVLQIPVFIALYEVLYVAIELRHAPLFLWIHDLSAKDPYYISPLLMGGTMFLQQKMTPSTMDPTQAKMMLMMPIVFTFMFLKFPSGLVVYWLVNNILTIAQQYYIQKKPSPAKA